MSAPLRAVLVDDEQRARMRLRELLDAFPDIVVVGEADSVESAAALLGELQADVIFLDVEMPPGNGFQLLPMLVAHPQSPEIVFVTGHEIFAVSAFAVSALDYLLKPIHPDRLALTVGKLKAARQSRGQAMAGAADVMTLDTRVSLNDGKKQCVVEVREIAAIQSIGAYSRVSLRLQPSLMVLRSISEWGRRLPAAHFSRIDRFLIVQPALLKTAVKISRDETVVTLDGVITEFSIGRAAASRLKRHLDPRG